MNPNTSVKRLFKSESLGTLNPKSLRCGHFLHIYLTTEIYFSCFLESRNLKFMRTSEYSDHSRLQLHLTSITSLKVPYPYTVTPGRVKVSPYKFEDGGETM